MSHVLNRLTLKRNISSSVMRSVSSSHSRRCMAIREQDCLHCIASEAEPLGRQYHVRRRGRALQSRTHQSRDGIGLLTQGGRCFWPMGGRESYFIKGLKYRFSERLLPQIHEGFRMRQHTYLRTGHLFAAGQTSYRAGLLRREVFSQ